MMPQTFKQAKLHEQRRIFFKDKWWKKQFGIHHTDENIWAGQLHLKTAREKSIWPQVSNIKSLFISTNKTPFITGVDGAAEKNKNLSNSLFVQDEIHVLRRNLSRHRMAERRGPLVMTEGTERRQN